MELTKAQQNLLDALMECVGTFLDENPEAKNFSIEINGGGKRNAEDEVGYEIDANFDVPEEEGEPTNQQLEEEGWERGDFGKL